jgi:hypothetical protein
MVYGQILVIAEIVQVGPGTNLSGYPLIGTYRDESGRSGANYPHCRPKIPLLTSEALRSEASRQVVRKQ